MIIQNELEKRRLPDLMTAENGEKVTSLADWEVRRKEIWELIQRECYGYIPNLHPTVRAETLISSDNAVAGKALYRHTVLHIQYDFMDMDMPVISGKYATPNDGAEIGNYKQMLSLPVNLTIPKGVGKAPVFVNISISPLYAGEFMPVEELVDNGYAVASFFYEDVAFDRPNMAEHRLVYDEDADTPDRWGAIAKWAWAAGRVMDYLQTVPEIDASRVAVTGASRLGKAALCAGILDERFSLVMPVIDGTGGCSLYRGNTKEDIDHIIDLFPHWFCRNYQKYKGKTEQLPFDAHFLMSLCAPRRIYMCLGQEDVCADQVGEWLAAAETSKVYQLYGLQGFVAPDRLPQENDVMHDGEIGMHIRPGTHYVSRQDWQLAIQYRNRHHV